jgi:hypothetical protein
MPQALGWRLGPSLPLTPVHCNPSGDGRLRQKRLLRSEALCRGGFDLRFSKKVDVFKNVGRKYFRTLQP